MTEANHCLRAVAIIDFDVGLQLRMMLVDNAQASSVQRAYHLNRKLSCSQGAPIIVIVRKQQLIRRWPMSDASGLHSVSHQT